MVRIDFLNILRMLDNFNSQHFKGDFQHTNDTVGLPRHGFLETMLFNALLFLTKSVRDLEKN